MKKINKFLALALVMTAGLTSCLKDDNITDQKYGIIEGVNTNKIIRTESIDKSIALAFEDKDVVVDFLPIHLSAEQPAEQDITITLSLDQSATLIEEYNEANDMEAVALPTSFYSLPTGLTVTIPKGSRDVALKVVLNAIDLDPSTTYALGLRITAISPAGYTLAGNFKSTVVTVSAKNDMDGAYSLVGNLGPATDRPTILIGTEWEWVDGEPNSMLLITSSGNTVDSYVSGEYVNFGGGISQWIAPIHTSTGGISGFGSVRPRFTFDPTSNKITAVTNMFPSPANGRALMIDPDFESTWSKEGVVDVYFIMTQPGFMPLPMHYVYTWTGER